MSREQREGDAMMTRDKKKNKNFSVAVSVRHLESRVSYVFRHKCRSQITLELLPFQEIAFFSNRGCCFHLLFRQGHLFQRDSLHKSWCSHARWALQIYPSWHLHPGDKVSHDGKVLLRSSPHPIKLEREDVSIGACGGGFGGRMTLFSL